MYLSEDTEERCYLKKKNEVQMILKRLQSAKQMHQQTTLEEGKKKPEGRRKS